MLWLVALFIILQPGIFSTKKTFVKVEDILLRALIFGIVMYFLGGSKEGFQISNNVVVNPTASQQAALDANAAAEAAAQAAATNRADSTCNPPDGYIFTQSAAGSGIKCLKQNVDSSINPPSGDNLYAVINYNESQRITIQDQTRYYTAPLMTKTQWNPEFMPLQYAFPYETHNAIFICVQSKFKLQFIDSMLARIPYDKWDAAASFWNSFIYEMPSTGASFTLIPLTAAAAPPLPIEPIPAEWLSGLKAAHIQSEAAAAAGPPPGYTGPPPPGPGNTGPQPYNVISSAPKGPTGPMGPPLPPGYVQAAFFGQNDINAGFDTIDTYLSQLSYGIKNLFNRQSTPTSPPAP